MRKTKKNVYLQSPNTGEIMKIYKLGESARFCLIQGVSDSGTYCNNWNIFFSSDRMCDIGVLNYLISGILTVGGYGTKIK